MTEEPKIDQRVFDLYDEYCHGQIDRREFLSRATAITIGGVSALWMAQALMPRYAEAQTISFTDLRLKGTYVDYPSPGGTSGTMRGYLVQPTGDGPFPAVLIIHENRGLNPHIEDVARRGAVAGFLALLVVSLVGLRPAFVGKPGPTKLLVALSGGGGAFSLYLTYLEAFVLKAWCRWCILIAVLVFSVFTTALLGLRERSSKT